MQTIIGFEFMCGSGTYNGSAYSGLNGQLFGIDRQRFEG